MVALFGTFNNQCTFFVGAVPMMSIFLELFHMTVFWIKPPLRLSGTSPQGEAFERSCRESRLRGGIKFSNISKGMLIASLNTEMF
jgi:hypothetical protein